MEGSTRGDGSVDDASGVLTSPRLDARPWKPIRQQHAACGSSPTTARGLCLADIAEPCPPLGRRWFFALRYVRPVNGLEPVAADMEGCRTEQAQHFACVRAVRHKPSALTMRMLLADQPFLSAPRSAGALAGDTFNATSLADVLCAERLELSLRPDLDVKELAAATRAGPRSRATSRLGSRPRARGLRLPRGPGFADVLSCGQFLSCCRHCALLSLQAITKKTEKALKSFHDWHKMMASP